jgi:hypothetical protein
VPYSLFFNAPLNLSILTDLQTGPINGDKATQSLIESILNLFLDVPPRFPQLSNAS